MRAMKDSGVEWIGEIPAEWKIGRVKNIFIRKNEKAMLENPVVLSLARAGVHIRDISNNEGQMALSYYNYNPVDIGDLLLNPMDLYSGANCSISRVKGVISPAYVNLKGKKNVDARYYDYYFKVQYWQMVFFSYGKGVSFENRWTLTNETLMNFKVLMLSYSEQQRIADYLDKKCAEIDVIISKQHSIIEKLKEYKLSLITETVTKGLNVDAEMKDSGIEWIGEIPKHWEVSRIKYICQFSPSCDISELDENSIVAYAPMECIKNGYFIEKYIKYSKLPKALTSFEDGDIVMAKVTPCFENGNISIMQNLSSKIGFGSSELFVFRAGKINKKFLFYWLQNSKFVEVAKSTMTGTGGLKRVSSKFVENSYICMPDFKAQKEIVDYLDNKCIKIEKIIIDKQKLISKLTEYKKSLIYEVVTGKKEV